MLKENIEGSHPDLEKGRNAPRAGCHSITPNLGTKKTGVSNQPVHIFRMRRETQAIPDRTRASMLTADSKATS